MIRGQEYHVEYDQQRRKRLVDCMNSGVKGIGIDRRCVIKEIERDRKAAEQPKRRP